MAQFNRGGELPEDEKYLARFCTSFTDSWPIVGEKFIKFDDGKICNQRLNNEILKKKKHLEKQTKNGSKGGRPPKTQTKPRLNPDEKPILNPTGEPDESQHKARDNPDETQDKPKNDNWVTIGLENKNPLGNGYGNGKGNGYGNSEGIAKGGTFATPLGPSMVDIFRRSFPDYPVDQDLDFEACVEIAKKIAAWKNWPESDIVDTKLGEVLAIWQKLVSFAKNDDWFSARSISDLLREFQRLIQKYGTQKRISVNRGQSSQGATNGFDPTKIEREGPGKLRQH
jgi:uncharacterized protein YdaU (DUF1376 family)